MSDGLLDNLLKETYKRNSHNIEDINSIKIPTIDRSFQKLLSETNQKEEPTSFFKDKFMFRLPKQIALVASFTALILLASSLLSIFTTTNRVQAVKLNILKTFVEIKGKFADITLKSTEDRNSADITADINQPPAANTTDVTAQKLSLSEIRSKINYPVIVSNYIPEGYKFKEATRYIYTKDQEMIEQVYTNGITELTISQTTNETNINSKITTSSKTTTKTLKVMNEDGSLISYDDNNHWLIWYSNNTRYEIIARFSEKELSKLIDSLTFSK
jgi:uncharacterized membrane protein